MKKILTLFLVMIMLTTTSASASSQPSLWATDEVKTAISLGLVPKDLQSNYSAPITRIEFVQLLAKLANTWAPNEKFEPNLVNNMFLDTNDENVLYFASLEIIEGDGKKYFMPKNLLQRQQAAKILYKTADNFTLITTEDTMNTTIYRGYASYEMPHSFKDSSLLRSWSRAYVNWCYRHGIMEGVSDNKFAPEETCTREQAIVTSLRLYYAYGMADKISTVPPIDYYPVYDDSTMQVVSYWIDSTLTEHSVEELGSIPLVGMDNGLYAIQNTDKKVTLFDAFGDTISEINSESPIILRGFANGLIVIEGTATQVIQYYTPSGKRLPLSQ